MNKLSAINISAHRTRGRSRFTKPAAKKRNVLYLCIVVVVLILMWASLPRRPKITHIYSDPLTITAHAITEEEVKDIFLTRPDGRGGTVRVLVAMVSTSVNKVMCSSVASAYLSGLPVVVVGIGSHYESHIIKPKMFLHYARQAGLRPSDILLAVDADLLFTGSSDFLAYIDAFIVKSATSAETLDARAVREGRAMAPLIYSAELSCGAHETLGEFSRCRRTLAAMDTAYARTVVELGMKPHNMHTTGINGGVFLTRLWAYEEFDKAYDNFMSLKPGKKWNDDQSVVYGMFHNLRWWEMSTKAYAQGGANLAVSPIGMHAGLMELDERNDLASITWCFPDLELSNVRWLPKPHHDENFNSLESSPLHRSYPTYRENVTQFVRSVYRQHNESVHQRAVPRSRTPGIRHIDMAPPLFSVKPREASNYTRVFPGIFHFAGDTLPSEAIRYAEGNSQRHHASASESASAPESPTPEPPAAAAAATAANEESFYNRKKIRLEYSLQYMAWYIPMKYSNESLARAKRYLRSMPLELWSMDTRKSVPFHDTCGFPFTVR